MARKPTSSSRGRKADDPLVAEQRRLLEAQEALLREQERARRVIEEAPKRLKQIKQRQRDPIRLNLNPGRPAQKTFGLPHDKFRTEETAEPRKPRKRKAERNLARLQFVVLCVILAVIVLLLWSAIPVSQ
jgi:hypothetical protein